MEPETHHLNTHEEEFLSSLNRFWKVPIEGRLLPRVPSPRARFSTLCFIRTKLGNLFQDAKTENVWLRTPDPALGDRTPLAILQTGSAEDAALLKKAVQYICGGFLDDAMREEE